MPKDSHINGYTLIRNWYNFKFENPDKVRHIHSDLYCYVVDLWNRLGQKQNFGLPTMNTMELMGIGSYNTYKKALNDLFEWEFIILVKDAKNQHHSKIVALSFFDKATDKALDKATIKATDEPSDEPTDSIVKPINKKQLTIEQRETEFKNSLAPYLKEYGREILNEFYLYWTEMSPKGRKMRYEKQTVFDTSRRLGTWSKRESKFKKEKISGKKEKSVFQGRVDQADRINQMFDEIEENEQSS